MAKTGTKPNYRRVRPGDGVRVLEVRVEKALQDAAKAAGGRAWKWSSPGQRGVPDRIVTLPGGRTALVEVKREGLRSRGRLAEPWHPDHYEPWDHPALSTLQADNLLALAKLGQRVAVVDDRDQAWEFVAQMMADPGGGA